MSVHFVNARNFNDIRVASRLDQSNRSVYYSLLNSPPGDRDTEKLAKEFLLQQLDDAENISTDLPSNLDELFTWTKNNWDAVGKEYRAYLISRKQGSPRRFFFNKSHALFFLKTVAPTKLVDGSWLYGLLKHWEDARFSGLIQTYLEELGDGCENKNHVALFKKLLSSHDLDTDGLDDEFYLQGAIQLALSRSGDDFLPEIVGFNLGYEQLPLHLLITTYELAELGIDNYYFLLHITIDNLDSGHAKKALQGVLNFLPEKASERAEFSRRLLNGYRLNYLGKSTCSIIESFHLEREINKLFNRKAAFGQYMHSDKCKVGGRSINDWLALENGGEHLLQALENHGWIKRHENPINSRFWHLIRGDKPLMFGVFTDYEQQLIYDWIAGDIQIVQPKAKHVVNLVHSRPDATSGPVDVLRCGGGDARTEMPCAHQLDGFLKSLPHKYAIMKHLISVMSPAVHATPIGFSATQLFKQHLFSSI